MFHKKATFCQEKVQVEGLFRFKLGHFQEEMANLPSNTLHSNLTFRCAKIPIQVTTSCLLRGHSKFARIHSDCCLSGICWDPKSAKACRSAYSCGRVALANSIVFLYTTFFLIWVLNNPSAKIDQLTLLAWVIILQTLNNEQRSQFFSLEIKT